MLSVVCYICNVSISFGEAAHIAVNVTKIEVAVSVPVVCPVDEEVVMSLDEPYRVLRLHIFAVVLRQDGFDEFPGGRVVHVQHEMLLASVKDLYEDA